MSRNLERARRTSCARAAINRIEREYRVTSQDGRVVEALTTSEDMRPFTPQALVGAV